MSQGKRKTNRRRGRPPGSNAEQVILAGAWQAFSDHGFHDCSVATILEYSESSRTNFYRFFKNKAEVFACILKNSIDALDGAMARAFNVADDVNILEQKFEIVVDCYIRSCFMAGDILPVLFQEQYTMPEHKALREALFGKIQKGIETTIAKMGYAVPDPLLIQAVMAGVDRVILQLSLQNIPIEVKEEKAREVVNLLSEPFLSQFQGLHQGAIGGQ